MSREAGTAGTVLHVADVAGVAHVLVDAINEHTRWNAEQIALPDWGASGGLISHSMGRLARAVRVPGLVRRAAADSGAGVVHLHWARFAPLLARQELRMVVHVHGSDVRDRSGRTADAVQRALQQAAVVLVSTPDLAEHVDTASTYLPNPIPIDLFQPGGDIADAATRPSILLFARLSQVKGAPALIETARQIRKLDRTVRVVGLGGGEFDAAAIRAGVELMSALPRAGVVDLLQRTDVVLGQQGLGALGLSELEAMSCAKPIVMPLRVGLYGPEVPVVCADEPADIAAAALGLLNDRSAAETLGIRARDYVVTHHSCASVASRLSAVYDAVRDA